MLYETPIRNHLRAGDALYDPFLGSGTALVAAERSGTRCYPLEVDPVYVEVALRRWERFSRIIDTLVGPMTDAIRMSFDRIAGEYAREFADELRRKPYDRELLAQFASNLPPEATVLDIGTGAAGHIGRFLADRGLVVTGVDLSPGAIAVARTLNPNMTFLVADYRSLPLGDACVDAIVGFYCFIYGTDDDVVAGLAEAARILRPGGRLLAAVHGALDDRPREEAFTEFHGKPVDITMRYTSPATFGMLAERAGLRIDELRARDPYEFEHPSRRLYLVGTAP